MLEVTVKTLDGKNRSFCVPDEITVRAFKEKIAHSIEIAADSQRLIFKGRVLQDEKKLNDYDVNSKTLHVVAKPPPTTTGGGASNVDREQPTPSTTRRTPGGASTMMFGSYNLPGDGGIGGGGPMQPNQLQTIVQQALAGMGGLTANPQVTTRTNADGSSFDVHINLGNLGPVQIPSEAQGRINIARRMLRQTERFVSRLERIQTSGGSSQEASADSSRDASPMDDSPAEDAREEAAAAAETAREEGSGQQTQTPPERETASVGGQVGGSGAANRQPRQQPHPRSTVLADLLGEVFQLNTRLQPFLEQYREILASDRQYERNSREERNAQSVCEYVSHALHSLSHLQHAVSDLMVDCRAPAPRTLRAPPAPTMSPFGHHRLPPPMQTSFQVRTTAAPTSASATQGSNSNNSSTSTTSTTAANSSSTTTTATSTAAATSASSSTLPGSVASSLPAGVSIAASSEPYVFVDVGPDSININSVSAHVVTSEQPMDTAAADEEETPATESDNAEGTAPSSTASTSTSTSTSTSSSSQAPPPPPPPQPQMPGGGPPLLPPGMMQNMIQMAQNAAAAAATGGPQPQPQVFVLNAGGSQPVPMQMPGTYQPQPPTSTAAPGSTPQQHPPPPPPPPPPPGMHPPPLPPQVIQNIIQMVQRNVGGAMGGGAGGSHTHTHHVVNVSVAPASSSTQSSSSSSSSSQGAAPRPTATTAASAAATSGSTRSTTTQSTAGGAPRTASVVIPGPAGGILHHAMVDPYLPCPSRHFTNQRVRQAGQQQQQQLHQVPLDNLMNNLLTGQAVPAAGGANTNRNNPGPQGDQPLLTQQLRDLLQQGQQQQQQARSQQQQASTSTATSTSTTTSSSSSSSAQPGHVTDEFFAQMVSGIGSMLSQAAGGSSQQTTIAHFLQSSGLQQAMPEEEGLVHEVFQVVSRQLTFSDLLSIFAGVCEPLQRLRRPLQEFIRGRVLNGEPPSDENLLAAAGRLVEDCRADTEQACRDVATRDNIDYVSTIMEFAKKKLHLLMQLIVQATDDAAFARDFFASIRTVIHEFIVIGRVSLDGGVAALERLVQGRVTQMAGDVNPMIRQWMSAMTSQQLHRVLATVTITDQQVEQYLIHRAGPQQASQGASQRATSPPIEVPARPSASAPAVMTSQDLLSSPAHSQSSEASFVSAEGGDGEERAQAMEVEDESTQAAQKEEAEPGADIRQRVPADLLASLPPPPTQDRPATVQMGAEDWHTAVPQEWVGVITQDISRQRRPHASQQPFSDAYISGMPNKRRRTMTSCRAETNPAVALPTSAQQAATATRSRPITSMDALTTDLESNERLHEAFRRQLSESVQERIAGDPDYIPCKYPHTERQFNKKDDDENQ